MPITAAQLIAIVEGIVQGAPAVLAAYATIKAKVATGQDPTAEEWTALNASADAVHAQIQAAG